MQLELTLPGNTTRQAASWQPDLMPSLRANDNDDSRAVLELLGKIGFTVFLHNRQSMPAQLRRVTLNKIRNSAVHALGRDGQLHRLRNDAEASVRNRDILTLARRVSHELAMGYKSLIEPTMSADSPLANKAHRSEVIGEAMRWLMNEMLFAFESYLPPPEHAWPEICQLYQAADSLGLADHPLDGGNGTSEARHTVRKRFQQAALLLVSDPFRLPAREIWQVKRYLDWWADEASLRPAAGAAEGAGRFLIDLQGEFPPPLLHGVPPTVDPASLEMLDTAALLSRIRGHLDDTQHIRAKPQPWLGEANGAEASQMLRRLLFAWHRTPQRHQVRHETAVKTKVLIGLPSVHNMLMSAFPEAAVTADFTAAVSKGNANKPMLPQHSSPTARSAEQLNCSACGAMIRILPNDADPTLPMVGTMIAMKVPAEEKRNPLGWDIGMVRWLTHSADGSLTCGIQFLRGRLHPVTVWPAEAGISAALVYTGIWLAQADDHDDKPASLITSHGLYQYGEQIMMIGGTQQLLRGRMDKLIEASDEIERFFCDVVEQIPTTRLNEPDADDDLVPFVADLLDELDEQTPMQSTQAQASSEPEDDLEAALARFATGAKP